MFSKFFIEKLNKKYKKTISITDETIKILKLYSWPGNVRELENLIEYLFIMNTSDEIDIEQLPPQVLVQRLYNKSLEKSDSILDLSHMVEKYEKSIILSTLRNYPSIRQASKTLGVHYSTLSRKLKKYNIDFDVFQ